ncbi:hypothetical protein [Parvibaculum sp.]|uniref:hypothetical protein n=1 Tax=Parvibaculum sp. TaxID=2024848 RepID=UPI001D25ADDD|nr:hypothetical protein [Parvibaculum sp.]MBX3490903.1 hypothetical protein [Parvibaculum sp.]
MSFYDEMREVADELLGAGSEFAQGTLALSVFTPGSGPAHNPGAGTYADIALSGTVGTPFVDNSSATYEDGSAVQVNDLLVTCAVPPTLPKMTDKVKVDGVSHDIKQINELPAAGTAVALKIYVRK